MGLSDVTLTGDLGRVVACLQGQVAALQAQVAALQAQKRKQAVLAAPAPAPGKPPGLHPAFSALRDGKAVFNRRASLKVQRAVSSLSWRNRYEHEELHPMEVTRRHARTDCIAAGRSHARQLAT